MHPAIQAIIAGAGLVVRAPVLIAVIYTTLVAAVLPAAVVVASSLKGAFAGRTIERVWPGDVDATWFERAGEAVGSAAGTTFTLAIIGFATQLSNVADLVEGESREAAALASLIVWAGAWTFLLGGVLSRYARPTPATPAEFMRASLAYFPRFIALAAGTLAIYAMAAVAHAAVSANLRIVILVPLVLLVGAATVVASYARARIALENVGIRAAVEGSLRILRTSPLAVMTHALLALAGWLVVMASLAWLDHRFGAGTNLWRVLLVTQLYVIARVTLRLLWEASAVSFVRNHQVLTSP